MQLVDGERAATTLRHVPLAKGDHRGSSFAEEYYLPSFPSFARRGIQPNSGSQPLNV